MWEKIKKVNKVSCVVVLVIITIVILSFINVFFIKNPHFFEMSIAQALTLLIATIVAFWATQKKTDERKVKDQVEKIIEKIQDVVSSPDFVTFSGFSDSEEVQKTTTMTIRKLKNATHVLNEYSKILSIEEDVKYIDEQIRGYNDFVSAKVGDIDYLAKSEVHLRKYADNIDSKCDLIIVGLYTKK